MYKEVISFITPDDKLFLCEDKAREHSQDILGQELDALVRLAIPDIDRGSNYKAALTLLKEDNREELKRLINSISKIVYFE